MNGAYMPDPNTRPGVLWESADRNRPVILDFGRPPHAAVVYLTLAQARALRDALVAENLGD